MLTTPESIRTLQRKLYSKAKQEKTYRFYALYDKVYRADILSHAYNLVRANKGSAGIDGITFEAIETGEGITAFLAELEEALKSKTYRPDPVKRVMIPKTKGAKRPLGIPTIRDRTRDTSGLHTGRCTRGTGFTKCRQQRFGRGRMPCSEEHRKAVCEKIACTV